jgi:hypothetical protein
MTPCLRSSGDGVVCNGVVRDRLLGHGQERLPNQLFKVLPRAGGPPRRRAVKTQRAGLRPAPSGAAPVALFADSEIYDGKILVLW